MDHETGVASPQANATERTNDTAAAERAAAFKRGAPIPKTAVPKKESPKMRAPAKSTPTPQARAADADAPAKPSPSRTPRTRAPKPDPDATSHAPNEAATPAPGEPGDGTAATTARKRNRRGGRGRGGRPPGARPETGGEPGTVTPAAPAGGDARADEAPVSGESADTQRDDALPDTDGATGARAGGSSRRRRRGSRGAAGSASGSTEAASQPASKPTSKQGEGEKRTARPKQGGAKTKSLSVEEQVAAGGPTRGIRNTRSRTGRSGGGDRRRRREPDILPPRITDKLMVITEHGDRDQIAVLEEEVLVQHYVTRTGATSMVGNVYLGRVQNVLPGMEAAFVDIGRGRNGVLYAGEVNYTPEDLEGPAPRIEQVLKPGQAVMVQVTKDPMGGKGARLTAQISLPGRYLVFAPNQNLSGISRRLPDEERKRLKSLMKRVKPDAHGVIVRTAAEGAPEENLTHDLERLVRQWDEIQRQAKKVKAPDVLYEEPELTVRVFRDLFTDEEYRQLVTDSPRVFDKIMRYVKDVAPDMEPKVKLHQGKLPAFEEHRIVEQIHKALDRKVWLASGGYLIIERTEAMTIVDVNTGKSVGKTNLEETVVNTNLEAAAEVARQLRLRDIGGIIVIDFIDMLLEKNKKQVEDTMKEALAIDKTRSQVFEIGPLGLLQVTRKRMSGGLVESFSETCPTCEGRGILVNYEA